MLLRHLLAALAAGHVRRRRPEPERRDGPAPTRIDSTARPALRFDGPWQDTIAALAPGDVWDAFSALPHGEQLRLIEAELATLVPGDRARVLTLLGRELQRRWLPLPGPQTAALTTEADVLFYGGGAGGGKSALLCGVAVTEHHRSRLFRRESVQVRGLVDECTKIMGSRDGYSGQQNVWRLPGDRQIEFAHCQYEHDKEKYQGRAADLIGFDEITHFSESQFRYLINWNRAIRDGAQQRTRVIVTGNPPETAEGRWVVAYWAPWLDPDHPNPAQDGELRWFTTIGGVDREVDGPGPHGTDALGQPIVAKSRTFIRSRVTDNPYMMEAGYAATLQSLPEPLRSMLLEGRFDLAASDDPWQVIPSSWVELAQRRWTIDPPAGALMTCMGVDVAQGGADETVLVARHGSYFAAPKAFKGVDTKDGQAVAGLVFAHMRDGCEIAIDVGGGWGADAHGHLKGQKIKSVAVNWVEPSIGVTRAGSLPFLNKRAESWWRLREALDPNGSERIALPPDKTLAADLATPLWRRTPSGLIKIEDKADIRKRIGRSPDRGDAAVMAWAHGGLVEQERANNPRPTMAVVEHADAKRRPHRSATSRSRSSWR